MKKLLMMTALAMCVFHVQAQRFKFNNLQSGSISMAALFDSDKESLGKSEEIESVVEFVWLGSSLKVVGKTNNGDTLFEFGKGLGHRFYFDYSDKNHLNIAVVRVEDLSDPEADGIATIVIDPRKNEFDVYFPEIFATDPLDLIRFISKNDSSQEQKNTEAYNELRKKLKSNGFLDD